MLATLCARGFSIFDSISTGISNLFVRDIYLPFHRQEYLGCHCTRFDHVSVPFIITPLFVHVPFLQGGIFKFYLRLTGAIAVPIMTVILMGVFTWVHRETGLVGLLIGLAYRIFSTLAD